MGTATTIKLRFPFKANGKTVNSVTVRRPTVADMRAVGDVEEIVEAEVAMMARITGINPEDLGQMDRGIDYTRLVMAYNDFFVDKDQAAPDVGQEKAASGAGEPNAEPE